MLLLDFDYAETEVENQKISPEQIREIIRTAIGPHAWKWLLARWDDKIFTVKFLFIKKTVRVRELESVWEYFFGDKPIPEYV